MVAKLFLAWCLMALSVAIHAAGVTAALRWARNQQESVMQFWRMTWLLIGVAGWTLLLHLLEISAWALLYLAGDAIGDLASALYFSAVTYTTTGYGDVVLPQEWRLVGGVKALTGILLCGWSTGFFFAVISRIYGARSVSSE
jgi:hypothetical protein